MKISISAGHNKNTGAEAYNGDDEWTFNKKLEAAILNAFERSDYDFDVKTHERDGSLGYTSAMSKLAGEIKSNYSDICLELHFNSASPSANGYEFLYYYSSSNGKALASYLSDHFDGLGFAKRRGTGTLSIDSGDRGSAYLRLTPCPAIIVETHFGSNADDHDLAIVTMDEQAERIVNGVVEYGKAKNIL